MRSLSELCLDLVQAKSKGLTGERAGLPSPPRRASARVLEVTGWPAGATHFCTDPAALFLPKVPDFAQGQNID